MRLFDPETTHTVAELSAAVRAAISSRFPDELWVRGEISGFRPRPGSPHVYFDLVEPAELGDGSRPTLGVALFSGNRRTVNTQLKRAGITGRVISDGVEVRIRGQIEVHRNRVQLVMTGIDPEYTLGRLAADKDQLLRRLATEGLLERNGRIPVPTAPRRIALVTSAGSAAEHDFVHELERSRLGFHVRLVDVRVQGELAEHHLVAGLRTAARWDADVVAVVRGGGSRTDLMAFDSEALAREVAACRLPVFTGIGHEVDRSVADDVAHTATKTPTACAAALVGLVQAFVERTESRRTELHRRSLRTLDRHEQRLLATATSCAHRGTRAVERQDRTLQQVGEQLARRGPRAVLDATRRLDAVEAQVRALDPERALRRGWTITRDADGQVVRRVDQVAPGSVLVTQLADGSVHSTVDEVHEEVDDG